MFLFESIPLHSWMSGFAVLAVLILGNEITRRWKWAGLAVFFVLPLILSVAVWPRTAGSGSSTGTWFHWVKVYSVLIACLGFMAIRYIESLQTKKWALAFPAAILAINILEACIRDFQIGAMGANEMVDGVFMVSGPWNYMNGIAGLLNILTICGWFGIFISKDKTKDMIWPDMMWFWIIAYDLWNFAYVYNCVGDHSFYAGLLLLLSCTIPAFWIKKGAWIQHRAHTLAMWMMWTMAVPGFVTDSTFAVQSSHSPTALMTVSVIALAANVAVFGWQVMRIVERKVNPITQEIYDDTRRFQEVKDANIDVLDGVDHSGIAVHGV